MLGWLCPKEWGLFTSIASKFILVESQKSDHRLREYYKDFAGSMVRFWYLPKKTMTVLNTPYRMNYFEQFEKVSILKPAVPSRNCAHLQYKQSNRVEREETRYCIA